MLFDELTAMAFPYRTDKSALGHFYTRGYNEIFSNKRTTVNKVLELGIETGASLKLWEEYFPQAMIYGVDVIIPNIFGGRIRCFQADVGNKEHINEFIKLYCDKPFDLIIDDASHFAAHQVLCMSKLWPHVKDGGYYVIEDLHAEQSIPVSDLKIPERFDKYLEMLEIDKTTVILKFYEWNGSIMAVFHKKPNEEVNDDTGAEATVL